MLNLVAACASDLMLSNVQFSLKEVDANAVIRMFPGMDGMEALKRIKAINEAVPIVMISAHGTTSTAFEASKRGAVDFIEKPFGAERLLVTIRNQLDRTRLIDENKSLRRAADSFELVLAPGISTGMLIKRRISKPCRTRSRIRAKSSGLTK